MIRQAILEQILSQLKECKCHEPSFQVLLPPIPTTYSPKLSRLLGTC